MELERVVEIYYENYAQLRAVAYSIVCNGEDADDVMQTVMLRLVERPKLLKDINAPKAFLKTCIRNEAITLWRKKRIVAVPIGEDIEDVMPSYQDTGYDRQEGLLYIKAYIKKLPPEIQEAFIAHVLDGHKIVDLAKQLGMKPDALERKFRQIKLEIRQTPGSLFTMVIFIIC